MGWFDSLFVLLYFVILFILHSSVGKKWGLGKKALAALVITVLLFIAVKTVFSFLRWLVWLIFIAAGLLFLFYLMRGSSGTKSRE